MTRHRLAHRPKSIEAEHVEETNISGADEETLQNVARDGEMD